MRKTSPTKDSFTARFLSSDASSSFHFVFLLFRGEDMWGFSLVVVVVVVFASSRSTFFSLSRVLCFLFLSGYMLKGVCVCLFVASVSLCLSLSFSPYISASLPVKWECVIVPLYSCVLARSLARSGRVLSHRRPLRAIPFFKVLLLSPPFSHSFNYLPSLSPLLNSGCSSFSKRHGRPSTPLTPLTQTVPQNFR